MLCECILSISLSKHIDRLSHGLKNYLGFLWRMKVISRFHKIKD